MINRGSRKIFLNGRDEERAWMDREIRIEFFHHEEKGEKVKKMFLIC